jgi:hypothetical protein
MAVRAPWMTSEDGLTLLSGSYLELKTKDISQAMQSYVWCKMFYSYNTANQQTTIFTAGHNAMHLQMIESLRQYSRQPCLPSQLLPIWFATVVDCFQTRADAWDDHVGEVWTFCLSLISQKLKTLQSLTKQSLEKDADLLSRIETTEGHARTAEMVSHDFSIFRTAVKDMPVECKILSELAKLDDSASALLLGDFLTIEKRCRAIENLLVRMAGTYDRYLNLVCNSLAGHIRNSHNNSYRFSVTATCA